MNSNLSRHSKKVTIILFIGLLVFYFGFDFYSNRSLNKHFKITIGQVSHISNATYKNNNRGIQYNYYVNGTSYSGEVATGICDNYTLLDISALIVNRKFPVAYDTLSKKNSIMILSEKLAKRFNYGVTDTLLHYDSILNCQKVFGEY
jgi:hypothetical protein